MYFLFKALYKRFLVVVLLLTTHVAYAQKQIYHDLTSSWDTTTVLQNPDKGWYIHYYDNGLNKYGKSLKAGDYLKDFKGLNHIYLRLAWSYLEPTEGVFNWQLIDSIINRWTNQGYKITFRISCKETTADQVFATPEWVKQAGAKGAFVGKNKNWEPDFGDAVFLQKLENFHRVFGKRYSKKDYLEYVDIGSIGDWGEGHTYFGSKREYSPAIIKKHIDMYKRCYPGVLLMISDDIVTSRNDPKNADAEEIMRYILANGIALRDDSVSVKVFADQYGFSTLRSQYLFDKTWLHTPGDLELEHYSETVKSGTWNEGKPLAAAIREAHATFVGFHGEPRLWTKDNPGYADALTNHIGYWYFIKGCSLPGMVVGGEPMTFSINWINKGVAPGYHQYAAHLMLVNQGKEVIIPLRDFDNRNWMPDSTVVAQYTIMVPSGFKNGITNLYVRLAETTGKKNTILLGMQRKNSKGYYSIGKVNVLARKVSKKKKIVFFGDSITQDAFTSHGYASILQNNYPVTENYELIGQGVGGDRTIDLMKRVNQDVLPYKPDKVVMMVGVNDCGWQTWHPKDEQVSLQQYEVLLDSLTNLFLKKKVSVVIGSPLIIGENQLNPDPLDEKLQLYVAACKRVAEKNHCAFVDLRAPFVKYLKENNINNQEKGILTADGIHPNIKGSELIAKELVTIIN